MKYVRNKSMKYYGSIFLNIFIFLSLAPFLGIFIVSIYSFFFSHYFAGAELVVAFACLLGMAILLEYYRRDLYLVKALEITKKGISAYPLFGAAQHIDGISRLELRERLLGGATGNVHHVLYLTHPQGVLMVLDADDFSQSRELFESLERIAKQKIKLTALTPSCQSGMESWWRHHQKKS